MAAGTRNDETLRWLRRCPATTTVVAAWGNHGAHLGRAAAAVQPIVQPTVALKVTQRGCPAHPLYLPASTRFFPCEGSKVNAVQEL